MPPIFKKDALKTKVIEELKDKQSSLGIRNLDELLDAIQSNSDSEDVWDMRFLGNGSTYTIESSYWEKAPDDNEISDLLITVSTERSLCRQPYGPQHIVKFSAHEIHKTALEIIDEYHRPNCLRRRSHANQIFLR